MNDKLRLKASRAIESIASTVIAIVSALIMGFLVMFAFNPENALPAFAELLSGGASLGLKGIGQVLYYTAPYIILGVSASFSFQTGIFNMGINGQFAIGSMVAVLIAGLGTGIPFSVRWIVAIAAAALAGMLWAIVPGVLKAYWGASEVVPGIMMNYISTYLCNEIITNYYYQPITTSSKYIPADAVLPSMGFDKLFPGSNASSALIIALFVVVIVYIIIYKTTFGYGLRASGKNLQAARYAGVAEKKNIMLVMLIGGLLAGFAGGVFFLSSTTKTIVISDRASSDAAYAIPIALLAGKNPIGVIFVAFFMAWITVGGTMIQSYGFPTETVTMLTSIIFYFSALSFLTLKLLEHWKMKKNLSRIKEGN